MRCVTTVCVQTIFFFLLFQCNQMLKLKVAQKVTQVVFHIKSNVFKLHKEQLELTL